MSPVTILISGATGKQGRAVITALLRAQTDAQILALTRSADSPSAKDLAKNHNVKIVEGSFDDPADIFVKAGTVDQFFLMTTPTSFSAEGASDEERQGKALIDAALAHGVSQIVFTSVNRPGDLPSNVPHFRSKHFIEQHLVDRAGSHVKWSIVRPVFFMDNFTTGFMAKLISAIWVSKLGFERKLQLVAVKDIGEVAALALLSPAKFDRQKIDLAGDSLSFRDVDDVYKRVLGQPAPRTLTALGWLATKASKDMGLMFDLFRDADSTIDIAACKVLHPGLQNLEDFVRSTR